MKLKLTRTQVIIIPGMLTAFNLGQKDTVFGIDAIVFLLVMFLAVVINIYFETKKDAK
jgi:hypothetical protein